MSFKEGKIKGNIENNLNPVRKAEPLKPAISVYTRGAYTVTEELKEIDIKAPKSGTAVVSANRNENRLKFSETADYSIELIRFLKQKYYLNKTDDYTDMFNELDREIECMKALFEAKKEDNDAKFIA